MTVTSSFFVSNTAEHCLHFREKVGMHHAPRRENWHRANVNPENNQHLQEGHQNLRIPTKKQHVDTLRFAFG